MCVCVCVGGGGQRRLIDSMLLKKKASHTCVDTVIHVSDLTIVPVTGYITVLYTSCVLCDENVSLCNMWMGIYVHTHIYCIRFNTWS